MPEDPAPATLSLQETAALLGRTPTWLSKHLKALRRDHGFPLPLPGGRKRWSRAAVLRWIDYDEARTPPAPPANDQPDPALLDLALQRCDDLLGD